MMEIDLLGVVNMGPIKKATLLWLCCQMRVVGTSLKSLVHQYVQC